MNPVARKNLQSCSRNWRTRSSQIQPTWRYWGAWYRYRLLHAVLPSSRLQICAKRCVLQATHHHWFSHANKFLKILTWIISGTRSCRLHCDLQGVPYRFHQRYSADDAWESQRTSTLHYPCRWTLSASRKTSNACKGCHTARSLPSNRSGWHYVP